MLIEEENCLQEILNAGIAHEFRECLSSISNFDFDENKS